MKIIRFTIFNSKNPEDEIDVLFRSIFDLDSWKDKVTPLLLVDPKSDAHRTLLNRIQVAMYYLDYWRSNTIADYDPDFEFALEYFLAADDRYPDRFIRTKKCNCSQRLDLNLNFTYTFDTQSLPEDGRDWRSVTDDMSDADTLLFSCDRYYCPIMLIGVASEESPSNPVLAQKFITSLIDRCLAQQDIIIATTSAFLIADTDRESVFLFSSHGEDCRISNPDFQTFGVRIDDIYRRIFNTEDLSGQPAALMKNLMNSNDRELIKLSLPMFGDSVGKSFLFDRYRMLGR